MIGTNVSHTPSHTIPCVGKNERTNGSNNTKDRQNKLCRTNFVKQTLVYKLCRTNFVIQTAWTERNSGHGLAQHKCNLDYIAEALLCVGRLWHLVLG